jgi:hypothetical protein
MIPLLRGDTDHAECHIEKKLSMLESRARKYSLLSQETMDILLSCPAVDLNLPGYNVRLLFRGLRRRTNGKQFGSSRSANHRPKKRYLPR